MRAILKGSRNFYLAQSSVELHTHFLLQAAHEFSNSNFEHTIWMKKLLKRNEVTRFLRAHHVQNQMRQGGMWCIFHQQEFCGALVQQNIDRTNRNTSLAYWILPSKQRQGIATNAIYLVLKELFTKDKMHRVDVAIPSNNFPSLMFIRKLGFRLEGVRREAIAQKKSYVDLILWSMLRDEFVSLSKQKTF